MVKSNEVDYFQLLISKPIKLPMGKHLIAFNIKADQEHLDNIDFVSGSMYPGENKISFTKIENEWLGETRLENIQDRTLNVLLELKSDMALECSMDLNNGHIGKFVMKNAKDDYLKSTRLEDIDKNIKKAEKLLSQYEGKLIHITEPSIRTEYEERVEEINKLINDYKKLREQESKASTVILESTNTLNKKDDLEHVGLEEKITKFDEMLKTQEDILKKIKESETEIISHFDIKERKIITAITERIEKSEKDIVNTLLNSLDSIDNIDSFEEVNETLSSVHVALEKMKDEQSIISDTILSGTVNDISEVIDNPQFDVKHRLKVAIPIIPLVLQYETFLELKSGVNLEKAWEWLKQKFGGKS